MLGISDSAGPELDFRILIFMRTMTTELEKSEDVAPSMCNQVCNWHKWGLREVLVLNEWNSLTLRQFFWIRYPKPLDSVFFTQMFSSYTPALSSILIEEPPALSQMLLSSWDSLWLSQDLFFSLQFNEILCLLCFVFQRNFARTITPCLISEIKIDFPYWGEN